MDTLKKPEMLLGLTNTAALLGASLYFYRRLNNIETDLEKQSEDLLSTINKVKEMQIHKQHIKQLAGAIRELNNVMGSQRNEISSLNNILNFQKRQIHEIQEKSPDSDLKLTQDSFQLYSNRGNNPQYGNLNHGNHSPQPGNLNHGNHHPQPGNLNHGNHHPQPGNLNHGNYHPPQPGNLNNGNYHLPHQANLNNGKYHSPQPNPNNQQPNGYQPNNQPPNGYQPNNQPPNGYQPNNQPPNVNNQNPNGYQPNLNNNGYPNNGYNGNLIDLAGFPLDNQSHENAEEDDLDSEINAVRNAREKMGALQF